MAALRTGVSMLSANEPRDEPAPTNSEAIRRTGRRLTGTRPDEVAAETVALSGPLHGGATQNVMETLLAVALAIRLLVHERARRSHRVRRVANRTGRGATDGFVVKIADSGSYLLH